MDRKSQIATTRAITIGILLIPVNTYWIIQIEFVWAHSFPTCLTLLFNAVFILLLLTSLNMFFQKFSPFSPLQRGELLTIYAMVCISSALSGCDITQTLVFTMTHPFWYATVENEWAQLFHRFIPEWLSVDDRSALFGLYKGGTTFYQLHYIQVWIKPVLFWCGFTLILLFVMLCINVIIRKQWIERERLTYPITQLPLEMIREGNRFLKNRLMWTGFAFAGGINIINGVNYFYPSMPSIPCKIHNISYLFAEKPWNAMGWTPISFYPFVLGLGFLMPIDLSFSCWFFYLFWKMQRVAGSVVGLKALPAFPYPSEQLAGALTGLFIFAVWAGRHQIKEVLMAVSSRSDIDDHLEPTSYRTASVGLVGGTLFLTLFAVKAGMSAWAALVFFLFYFISLIALTRVRAELGPPVHELDGAGVDQTMVKFFGTYKLGARNLTGFSTFCWLNRWEAYRINAMPLQLESLKLAEGLRVDTKRLAFAMTVAGVAGALASFWLILDTSYKIGVSRLSNPSLWFAQEPFRHLQSWLNYPSSGDSVAISFMAIGLVFTILMMVLRMRFFWWPLHPAGYIVSTGWAMNCVWFPIFLSSVTKWIIIRYGGIKSYRKAVPFFGGLILGEYVIGSLWSIIGMSFHTRTYAFWL